MSVCSFGRKFEKMFDKLIDCKGYKVGKHFLDRIP